MSETPCKPFSRGMSYRGNCWDQPLMNQHVCHNRTVRQARPEMPALSLCGQEAQGLQQGLPRVIVSTCLKIAAAAEASWPLEKLRVSCITDGAWLPGSWVCGAASMMPSCSSNVSRSSPTGPACHNRLLQGDFDFDIEV